MLVNSYFHSKLLQNLRIFVYCSQLSWCDASNSVMFSVCSLRSISLNNDLTIPQTTLLLIPVYRRAAPEAPPHNSGREFVALPNIWFL